MASTDNPFGDVSAAYAQLSSSPDSATVDVIVHEEYVNEVASFFSQKCAILSDAINRYTAAINYASESGYIEGLTADALRLYAQEVQAYIAGNNAFTVTGASLGLTCSNYLERVDEADQGLY